MLALRPLRRLAAAWLALAAICGPVNASSAKAVDPDDALLLETRLGQYQIGEGIRGYAGGDGACLIFADVAATLDVAVEVDAAAGQANGWAFAEANRIAVDRGARTVLSPAGAEALGAQTIRDAPEGWCVDAAALGRWLGVRLEVDAPNALLFVRSDAKLPVERALERRARAARLRPAAAPVDIAKLPRVKLPYLLWRDPSIDAVVTVNGVRDRRSPSRVDARYELYASGEALRLSWDARLASDGRGVPASLRARAYRTDPDGLLLGPLRATQVAVGDVAGFSSPLVGLSIGGRGAMLTNRPVDRPESFDRTSFRGELPTGWDAELYRNGQLMRFAETRSDGRYEFLDVPLLYGANRFEIVLYGPQGQVRRRSEITTVGADSIPTGETYYWAGFSQDDRDLIRLGRAQPDTGRGWRGTAGLEHGIDARTSFSAQLHTLMLRDERLTFVEGSVRRAVGPALLEVSAALEQGGGTAVRAQLVGQWGDTYVSAESISASGGFRSDRVEPGVIGRHLLALDRSVVLWRLNMPAHLEARVLERRGAPDTLEAAARLSANFRAFSLTAGFDWQSRRARGRDPPDRLEATLLANGRVGRVRLRGEARYRVSGEDRGFAGATLVGEWNAGSGGSTGPTGSAQWRAEVGYDADARRGRGSLGYSRRFDRVAVGVSAEAATDGSVAAGLNLALSVGPRLGGGLRVTSAKLAGAGTAVARVWRDLNDDGVRQPGEPWEPGVQLTAGLSAAGVTDRTGRTVIDELTPFRPVAIGVDPSSLADPSLTSKLASRRVVPRPGVGVVIDVPLVGAGSVEGVLVVRSGKRLEGVDLELVGARGNVAATTRTEFDGFFLFDEVAYGEYRLRVAAASAAAAGLRAEIAAPIVIDAGKPTANLGEVEATSSAPIVTAGRAQ